MVAGCGVEHARAMLYAAAFGIVYAEYQPADAEQADGLGTHRAGFQGDHQIAIGQAWLAAQCGRGAQGEQFRVGGGVGLRLDRIAGPGEYRSVAGNHDGTHRDFPAVRGFPGLRQRDVHRGHHPALLARSRPCGLATPHAQAAHHRRDPGFGGPGGYSKYPWYAIRQNYAEAIAAADGLPVALPHDPALAAEYLDRIDALVVTGGAFDIDPTLYGDLDRHATVTLKQQRTAAEHALTEGALARNVPVLGICGGQQLLAVVLGGTLIQHIPDAIPGALEHEQPNPRHEPGTT